MIEVWLQLECVRGLPTLCLHCRDSKDKFALAIVCLSQPHHSLLRQYCMICVVCIDCKLFWRRWTTNFALPSRITIQQKDCYSLHSVSYAHSVSFVMDTSAVLIFEDVFASMM